MKESVKIVKLAWLARLYISKLMVMVLVVHVKFFLFVDSFFPQPRLCEHKGRSKGTC